MAIKEIDLKDKGTEYYETYSQAMFDSKSPYAQVLKELKKDLLVYNIPQEELAKIHAQAVTQMLTQINGQATSYAQYIIGAEKTQQEIDRKIQAFDDNVQMEMAKQQGGLAQFAVNAGSPSAQNAINDLKRVMNTLIERTDRVNGSQISPILDPEGDETSSGRPAAPQNVVASSVTLSSVTLSWDIVADGDLYAVYRDGIDIGRAVDLTFKDEGLDSNTSYIYNVSAYTGRDESGLSVPILVTTL